MRILSKLTVSNLKRNKKRSIVTMIGVALSVALIFTVIAISTSFFGTIKNYQRDTFGDFHQSFENIPGDKLSIVENAYGVESYYYSEPVTFGMDTFWYEGLEDPYPTELYQRIDQLADSDRVAGKNYTIYVRYTKPQRHERYGKDIIYALEDAGIEGTHTRVNKYLLRYDGDVDYNTTTILFSVGTLVVGILVIASIFTIRNSFNISTTERIREFGMLSSVGATPGQIRKSVILEALIIGLFAIPAGILIGFLATFILLIITNSLLDLGYSLSLYVPLWAIGANAALGLIIVWLSSASAAIRASRLSPIEAIRSTQDIKVKSKKLRTSKFVSHYFGVGGVVASKNLKRSRQKYRTTVISIVVSVAMFVGLSSFVIDGKRIVEQYVPDFGADYMISGGTDEQYRELMQKYDVKDYVYYRDVTTQGRRNIMIVSREYFEKYARSLGIFGDYDRIAILDDYVTYTHSNGATTIKRYTDYKDGDSVSINVYQDDDNEKTAPVELKISKVTDKRPMGIDSLSTPTFFVSENYYDRSNMRLANYNGNLFANPGDRSEELTEYFNNILADRMLKIRQAESEGDEAKLEEVSKEDFMVGIDVKSELKLINNIMLLFSIFLYGFVIVVALIGITNVFNTITTNVILRAREFAMLKSVGMTDDEFKRMIRLETIFYTLRALAFGLPIGILISYGVHVVLINGGMALTYQLPLVPIAIAIVAVSLLVTVIMRYSVRQISRQNIIETIRQDTN